MSETNESDILFPDKTLSLGGKDVTVREFKYLEGLKAASTAQPLIAGLTALSSEESGFDLSKLDGLLGQHAEVWLQLLSLSCGESPDWIGGLSDTDGTLLSLAFWEVNGPFLLRRVAFGKRFGATLAA